MGLSNSITVKENTLAITEMLINGVKSTQVAKSMTETTGLSERQTYRYINKIKTNWIKEREENKKYDVAHAVEVKQSLFREARGHNDYKTANLIHDSQCKIQGLFIDRVITENTSAPLNIQINIAPPKEDNDTKVI